MCANAAFGVSWAILMIGGVTLITKF